MKLELFDSSSKAGRQKRLTCYKSVINIAVHNRLLIIFTKNRLKWENDHIV